MSHTGDLGASPSRSTNLRARFSPIPNTKHRSGLDPRQSVGVEIWTRRVAAASLGLHRAATTSVCGLTDKAPAF